MCPTIILWFAIRKHMINRFWKVKYITLAASIHTRGVFKLEEKEINFLNMNPFLKDHLKQLLTKQLSWGLEPGTLLPFVSGYFIMVYTYWAYKTYSWTTWNLKLNAEQQYCWDEQSYPKMTRPYHYMTSLCMQKYQTTPK